MKNKKKKKKTTTSSDVILPKEEEYVRNDNNTMTLKFQPFEEQRLLKCPSSRCRMKFTSESALQYHTTFKHVKLSNPSKNNLKRSSTNNCPLKEMREEKLIQLNGIDKDEETGFKSWNQELDKNRGAGEVSFNEYISPKIEFGNQRNSLESGEKRLDEEVCNGVSYKISNCSLSKNYPFTHKNEVFMGPKNSKEESGKDKRNESKEFNEDLSDSCKQETNRNIGSISRLKIVTSKDTFKNHSKFVQSFAHQAIIPYQYKDTTDHDNSSHQNYNIPSTKLLSSYSSAKSFNLARYQAPSTVSSSIDMSSSLKRHEHNYRHLNLLSNKIDQ